MWSILFCFACMQSNSKPSATPRYFVAQATYKTTTCKWRQDGLQVATLVCVAQSKSFLGPKLPVIHGLLRATNRASAWPTLVGALPLSIYKFTVATYSLSTLASDRPPVHNEGLVHRGYLFSVHPCSQVAGNITSMACCYSTTWKLRTHFLCNLVVKIQPSLYYTTTKISHFNFTLSYSQYIIPNIFVSRVTR
jgi:hypothetical protein